MEVQAKVINILNMTTVGTFVREPRAVNNMYKKTT